MPAHALFAKLPERCRITAKTTHSELCGALAEDHVIGEGMLREHPELLCSNNCEAVYTVTSLALLRRVVNPR